MKPSLCSWPSGAESPASVVRRIYRNILLQGGTASPKGVGVILIAPHYTSRPRVSAAQAAAAEQQGNTFLSPLQAPRRLSGDERPSEAAPFNSANAKPPRRSSEAEQRTDLLLAGGGPHEA